MFIKNLISHYKYIFGIMVATCCASVPQESVAITVNTLQNLLNIAVTNLQTNINLETMRAFTAESHLQTNINSETSRATEAEASLAQSISDEASARFWGDVALNSKITSETSRAKNAEYRLRSDINAEENRAVAAETALGNAIMTESWARQFADKKEETSRKIADALLDDKIDSETSRAKRAEYKLQHEIDNEEGERKIADAKLNNKINKVNGKFYSGKENVNFKSVQLGKNKVSSIDDGKVALTKSNSQQIATAATVLKSAENAVYTGSNGKNIISSQTQTISSAINTLDNAIGDMDFSGTRYVSNSESITSAINNLDAGLTVIDNNVKNINRHVNNVEKHLRGGIAATAALTALVPNARDCGDTQVSIGSGNYNDKVGFAAGLFHYVSDRVLVNAGGSFATSNDWAFRAGVTFGL